MFKLVRESVEKAERLLAKKSDLIDEDLKAELSKHLELAQELSGDYRSLKEEMHEPRSRAARYRSYGKGIDCMRDRIPNSLL
jgi:uncharacterized coiled-coil DUF342 family protein